MLDRLRTVLAPSLEKLGIVFAKTGLSPNVWTAIGLILSLAAAVSYTSSEWVQGVQAWHAITIGSILLLASGFFDIVDGQVARATKNITKTGGFLDSIFDRVAEVAIFFGILVGGHANPYLVFLAVTFSLLVSYARSRAESSGVQLRGVGIGERPDAAPSFSMLVWQHFIKALIRSGLQPQLCIIARRVSWLQLLQPYQIHGMV